VIMAIAAIDRFPQPPRHEAAERDVIVAMFAHSALDLLDSKRRQ